MKNILPVKMTQNKTSDNGGSGGEGDNGDCGSGSGDVMDHVINEQKLPYSILFIYVQVHAGYDHATSKLQLAYYSAK